MGGGGGCGVSANEHSCAHGAQINFEDLTPYLTYDFYLGVEAAGIIWTGLGQVARLLADEADGVAVGLFTLQRGAAVLGGVLQGSALEAQAYRTL
jgi:hypothetical protein